MLALIIWINILIIIIGTVTVSALSILEIEQLLQWKLVIVFILAMLSLLLYKWRNSLRLDEPQVHIQFLDD